MIIWDDNIHSVKNEQIDNEHKKIFDILSEIYDKFIKNENNIEQQLLKLVLYTREHFTNEINYLNEHYNNKEEIEYHNKLHNKFIDNLTNKIDAHIKGNPTITI